MTLVTRPIPDLCHDVTGPVIPIQDARAQNWCKPLYFPWL